MFHLAKLMRAEKVRGRTECDVVASCELIADGTAVSYIPNLYCCWAEDSSMPSLHSMKRHLYRSDKSSRGLSRWSRYRRSASPLILCIFQLLKNVAITTGCRLTGVGQCSKWCVLLVIRQQTDLNLTLPFTAERHHSSYSVWLVLLHGFPSEEHVASRASH